MKKSTQVVVTGPLAPFAAGYQRELFGRGFSPWTSVSYLYSFARLSRWLADRGLAAADLDAGHIERFVAERPGGRRAGVRRRTPRGLMSLVGYLRAQGVVPDVTAPHGAQDALLDEFAEFLREERGLTDKTIGGYGRFAGLLLSGLEAGVDVRALTAQHVNAFTLAQAGRRGSGSLNNVVTALRSLLRFCYLRGYILAPMADATPRTVAWRNLGPSRGLGPGQVERLLASCDRRTSTGRRDFAILTVLARLGLRANEVATLQLDDVNWRAGEITVHGKGVLRT
jgi:site-specific recombinase XerD